MMSNMLTYPTMDILHENSVSVIESLQFRFQQQRDLLFMISNVFDPRYAFLMYAPILYSLDRTNGKKLMWVAVLAEWSNQILKWVLHGERPYWWVHETGVYNKTGTSTPAIQQYFLTCETGPGSPSGHSMVSAAVWYILIAAFLQKVDALSKSSYTRSLFSTTCWSIYAFLIFSVSLSRVYIAAHFPHQCLLGTIIGYAVATNMHKIEAIFERMNLRNYILTTAGLLASALATYAVLKSMGMNPLWSVDRAVKWCSKQEYIHVDTTPFFSMMRYCGFVLGMGFGFDSSLYRRISNVRFSLLAKVTVALLCVFVSKMSERIALPKSNNAVFYGSAFVLNAILPYLYIAVLPYFVSKFVASPTKKTQ